MSLSEEEVYLPLGHFPWFKDASLAQMLNVRQPSNHRLCWPDLGIDLAPESISCSEPSSLVGNDDTWLVA